MILRPVTMVDSKPVQACSEQVCFGKRRFPSMHRGDLCDFQNKSELFLDFASTTRPVCV